MRPALLEALKRPIMAPRERESASKETRLEMAGVNNPYRYAYETVAASQSQQVIGPTGATGDYLHRIVVAVATAATSTVSVIDGSTTILAIAANTPIGVYSIEVNAVSANGAWKITTGAGATVLAVGIFS